MVIFGCATAMAEETKWNRAISQGSRQEFVSFRTFFSDGSRGSAAQGHGPGGWRQDRLTSAGLFGANVSKRGPGPAGTQRPGGVVGHRACMAQPPAVPLAVHPSGRRRLFVCYFRRQNQGSPLLWHLRCSGPRCHPRYRRSSQCLGLQLANPISHRRHLPAAVSSVIVANGCSES